MVPLEFHNELLLVILGYYLLMNLILYIAMVIDKKRAIKGKWRIPEKNLFLLAALGGGLGGMIALVTKHHKSRHLSFILVYSITIVFHAVAAYYLIKTFVFV